MRAKKLASAIQDMLCWYNVCYKGVVLGTVGVAQNEDLILL